MDPISEILGRVENVEECSDADLASAETDLLDLFARVRAGEVEEIEHDDVERLTAIRDAVQSVRTEAASRLEAAAERAEAVAALEADLAPAAQDDDDEGGEGDGNDGDEPPSAEVPDTPESIETTAPAAVEPSADEREAEAVEPVTAAATALPSLSELSARAPSRGAHLAHMATPLDRTIRLVSQGRDVPFETFVEAMVEARESFLGFSGGGIDKVRVGRFDWRDEYDDSRRLIGDENRSNTAKVNALAAAAMDPANWTPDGQPTGALVASGGYCAPTPAVYDLAQISGAQRPVRDSLPSFNADRGGVRFTTPPNLAGVLVDQAGGAVGEWDNATDTTPGESVKTHQKIPCGEVIERFTKAIYEHVEVGVFLSRAYPEWVSVWMDNVMAAWARKAEQELLDAISGASTPVTQAAFLGAIRDLFPAIIQLSVAERNRQRMNPNTRLHVLIPQWIIGLLQMDAIRQGYIDAIPAPTEANLRSMFSAANVNVTFYEDSATGAGQIVAAQGAGNNMRDLPGTCQWFLFHEGAHVFLDGGTLDLGLVRDATLVETNDYHVFSESWEGHAYRGIFSYRVDQALCASGAGAATEDTSNLCSAS